MQFCIYLSTAWLRAHFRDFHMMSVTNNPLDAQERLKLTTQRAGTKTNNSSQTNLWTPRSFVFFWCPEVGLEFCNLRCPEVRLEFQLQVSRGPFRISTLRCPEVGLEFQIWGVQRSDWNFEFEVSRGWIRISTLRCPEVGLEFRLWGVQRSV